MEGNTVSLDTARKLKATGFPQDGALVWYTGKGIGHNKLGERAASALVDIYPDFYFAAATAQEIADQLPIEVKLFRPRKRWFATDAALNPASLITSAKARIWLRRWHCFG